MNANKLDLFKGVRLSDSISHAMSNILREEYGIPGTGVELPDEDQETASILLGLIADWTAPEDEYRRTAKWLVAVAEMFGAYHCPVHHHLNAEIMEMAIEQDIRPIVLLLIHHNRELNEGLQR